MLLIEDKDVQELLSMEACIEAMEEAFKEFASGVAVNRPRVRYTVPRPGSAMKYFTNVHVGAVPKYGVAAVRLDSSIRGEGVTEGHRRWGALRPVERSWAFDLLYSLDTGEPLAILHNFTISGMRVGATSAVAVKYLARNDAQSLGLIGTGKLARTSLLAISKVRPIKKVKVYSLSEEHRRSFCKDMSAALHIEIQPENNARSVVDGVDVVCCATNSVEPVFRGEWLTKGQLVISIQNTDVTTLRFEVDETTFVRSDVIVINDRESVFANKQIELLKPIEKGLVTWDRVRELGDILIGKIEGRRKPEELIYYKNNTGMGIQFAAAGGVIYREALKKGIGRELPTEWFGTDLSEWGKKGFYPSA